ncbi:hypothetical protein AB0N23_08745 [Streptomyces sp. NPDC052644]
MAKANELFDCSTPQNEYWTHVADQHELPIAPGKESVRKVSLVSELMSHVKTGGDDVNLRDELDKHLLENPNLLDEIRLFAGISDKRLYLALSYEFSRTVIETLDATPVTLCGCMPYEMASHSTAFFKRLLRGKDREVRALSSQVIANFLLKNGLADTLIAYGKLTKEDQERLLERLVFAKEAQQNEAKRRGHGAEAHIARVLQFSGCYLIPESKVENPMGAPDPNIDIEHLRIAPRKAGITHSCDIAVNDATGVLQAWVVSLVQSSDPGQFGVDKSETTSTIRRLLEASNEKLGRHVELWGIVDGVGYAENKAGTINRMLASFHEFFQVKSAYKAALAAHRLGIGRISAIRFDSEFYSSNAAAQMAEAYVPSEVTVLEGGDKPRPSWSALKAGMATIYA